jgi:hypothetical protein
MRTIPSGRTAKRWRRLTSTTRLWLECPTTPGWLQQGKGRHVYMIHAQNPVVQEAVSAILGGSVIPLIARDVYYAASELQRLENGIRRFKDKMAVLLKAGMNTEQRRAASRAIWEDTKEPAKKDLDTELLKEMGLVDWAHTCLGPAALQTSVGAFGAEKAGHQGGYE